MKKDRILKELVRWKESVWIYVDSIEICEKFFDHAEKEGFHFGNIPRSRWVNGGLIGIHQNGEMGHMPYFAYFRLSEKKTDIIDYRKYIENKRKFIYSNMER